jgi:hypothetical protein
MSDSHWSIAASARLSDGTDAAAFILGFYGEPSLFIATRSEGRWGRPRLVAPGTQRFADLTLRALDGKRLRAEFTAPSPPGVTIAPLPAVPDAIEFDLADVELDTDKDGWTDLEEARLGMDRSSADSDRDALPDSSDSTPFFAATRRQPAPADAPILRRALFAIFGLTAAPHALFVKDQSVRLELTNLPGPLFYQDAPGGVRVTWKIVSKSDTEARAEITDYEGPLAASGNEVTLRRIGAEWYVTGIRMLWIS